MIRALSFRTMALVLGGAALLSAPAPAQGTDLLFPSETDFAANRGLIRLVDLNVDGNFDGCGEFAVDFMQLQASPCQISQTGGSCANVRDVAYGLVGGVHTLFWVRTDTDLVERAVDLNGNGRIEAGEQNVFFDFPTQMGPGSYFVGNCAVDSTGALWVTTNASSNTANQGIYRFKDLNADGAATVGVVVLGEPEVSQYLTGTFTVPDAAGTGTVTLNASDFRALAVDATDRVIAFLNGSGGAHAGLYIAAKDLNGNYVWDAGEAVNLFYAPAASCGAFAALKQNTDVGVTFPLVFDWNANCVPSTPCTGFGNVLRMVHTSLSSTGQQLYWFASTSGTGFSCFKGIVLKGRDLTGNGDLNDPGEVTLWYNGSQQAGAWGAGSTPLVDGPNSYQLTIIEDMGAVGDVAYLFNDDGPAAIDNRERLGFNAKMDTIWRLQDMNNDGDADDPGEQIRAATLPPGEFWGPKGKILPIPSGAFAAPATSRVSGPGCFAPLSPAPDDQVIAQIGTIGNPSVPSATFAITLKESPTSGGGIIPGGGLPVLVVGVGVANLDLSLIFPTSIGCTLVPSLDILVTSLVLVPAGNFQWSAGSPMMTITVPVSEATAPIPIPPVPALIGGCVRAQWAVVGLDMGFGFFPFVSTELDARLGP